MTLRLGCGGVRVAVPQQTGREFLNRDCDLEVESSAPLLCSLEIRLPGQFLGRGCAAEVKCLTGPDYFGILSALRNPQ